MGTSTGVTMKFYLRSTVLLILALSLASCSALTDSVTLARLNFLPALGQSQDAELQSMDSWARSLGWSGMPLSDRKDAGNVAPYLVRVISPSTLKVASMAVVTSRAEADAAALEFQDQGAVAIVKLENFWPDRDWPTPAPGALNSLTTSQKAAWFFSAVAADLTRRFETADFRRALTVFLTDRLAEGWMEANGKHPVEQAQFQDLAADRAVFWQLSGDLVSQLRALGDGDHSVDERKSLTNRLVSAWRKNFSSEYNVRFRTSAYLAGASTELDLSTIGTWWDNTPLLQQLRSRWVRSGSSVADLLGSVASWPTSQREVP